MEMHDYITMTVQQQREKSFANSPQITLGQLITEIESFDLRNSSDEFKNVCFDFGSAVPTNLDSWRGSYSELALGYKFSGYDNTKEHFADITANDLLQELKSAIGKEYTGWKGGDFIMNEDTPVWVANPGNGGNTAIIGILDAGWQLVILTAYCEY